MRKKWESFYKVSNTRRKVFVAYNLVFIVRRLCYIFLITMLSDTPCFQIICLNLLNMIVLIYQGYFRPLNSRQMNNQELMNEIFIQYCSYMMILFSDFVIDDIVKETNGYAFLCLLGLMVALNFGFLFMSTVRYVKLLYIKYK